MPGQSRPAIVASVLPADFARLGDAVQQLEKGGVDRIQWDVMDGQFVPNLTFGPDVIAANRDLVAMGFEAHLMVVHPEPMLPPATPFAAVENVLDLLDLLLVMTANPGFAVHRPRYGRRPGDRPPSGGRGGDRCSDVIGPTSVDDLLDPRSRRRHYGPTGTNGR